MNEESRAIDVEKMNYDREVENLSKQDIGVLLRLFMTEIFNESAMRYMQPNMLSSDMLIQKDKRKNLIYEAIIKKFNDLPKL